MSEENTPVDGAPADGSDADVPALLAEIQALKEQVLRYAADMENTRRRAERDIAEAGFPAARLETDTFNQRSRAFYAGRGYQEADRYPDEEWNSGFTTLLLVKPLG